MVLILLGFIFPTLAISIAVPASHISFTVGVMQAFKSLLDHFGLSVLTPIIALGLVPAVSRAYWVFAALATEVHLITYVLMSAAAINLRRRQPQHPRGYRAPALLVICVVGALASAGACVVGLLPPSQLGHIATVPYLSALLAATLLVGLLPPLLLHKRRRSEWKRLPELRRAALGRRGALYDGRPADRPPRPRPSQSWRRIKRDRRRSRGAERAAGAAAAPKLAFLGARPIDRAASP